MNDHIANLLGVSQLTIKENKDERSSLLGKTGILGKIHVSQHALPVLILFLLKKADVARFPLQNVVSHI